MSNQIINKELLSYFIEFLKTKTHKSDKSILIISKDIQKFIDFANDAAVDAELFKEYLYELENKYTQASFLSKVSSLRQFSNWLNLKDDPFLDFQVTNSEDLFFYEHEQLMEKLSLESFKDLDYDLLLKKLVVNLVYHFYLSIDELISLSISDINIATGTLFIRSQELNISNELSSLLKFYIKEKLPAVKGDNVIALGDKLLVDSNNKILSIIDVRNIFNDYSLKVTDLRRSRIMHLLNDGLSSQELEAKLAIKLSSHYSRFIKKQDYRLLRTYNEIHPRASR